MFINAGLILLIVGVSLDSFGVGITYGMRKIRVPILALTVIMLCNGVIVLTSMTIGNLLRSFITPDFAELIGGVILFTIGVFCLYNVVRSKEKDGDLIKQLQENEKWDQFKTVLKKPEHADWDHSGIISVREALLLGLALALDAFGAGIGAAMLGYSPLLTPIFIAVMSGLFVYGGTQLGIFLSEQLWMKKLVLLPPFLLIGLGLSNIL